MGRKRAVLLGLALVTVSLAGCASEDGGEDDRHAKIMAVAEKAAEGLNTVEKAKAAGYQPDRFCIPGMGVHWVKPQLMDTKLEADKPEVVIFEPSTANFTDPESNRFVAVEYVAVTEGTEHNTTETVPKFKGQPLYGPMPGHTPEMPWHAELHVYLADDVRSTPAFEESHPEKITCPEGTTPPAPGEDGSQPAPVELSFTSVPDAVHRTLNASVNWTVANASGSVEEASLHWAETSVDDPTNASYGNTTDATATDDGWSATMTVPGAPNASGTVYLRAQATIDGNDHWSDEVEVPIEALEATTVTMTGLQYDPAELEVEAPAYVVWTNEDNVGHTVTFEELNGTEDNELADLAPGESVGYVFTEEGTFAYRCTYHSTDYSTGMVGQVTVTTGS